MKTMKWVQKKDVTTLSKQLGEQSKEDFEKQVEVMHKKKNSMRDTCKDVGYRGKE